MTQDERFLKAMNITPEAIPEPKRRVQSKADPLIPEEIDVERCGEFITMSIGDFQTMLSANSSLAEGGRQLQEDLASERGNTSGAVCGSAAVAECVSAAGLWDLRDSSGAVGSVGERMSEQVPRIQPVSSRMLMRAVERLNSEKHPEKLKAIDDELLRRKAA